MPLVSVVMPVYNGERFVRAAVESILTQTLRDFEFIIVDDGSTDGTASILQSFSDPRMRLFRNERNCGIVDSLNRGLAEARGIYVARMDADDVALPGRLERQIAFMQQYPAVAVLGTATIVIDEQGVEVDREYYPESMKDIRRAILVHNPFAHGSVVMKRSILQKAGFYDKRFRHNEDYDLWLRLVAQFDAANLAEPLVMRRVHRENITVAKETELVLYRVRTLAHAIVAYYHRPLYAVFLARPIGAYAYRLLRRFKSR